MTRRVWGAQGGISVPSDIHSAPEGDTRLSQEAFMAHLTLDSCHTCYGQCSLAASAANHELAVPFYQWE